MVIIIFREEAIEEEQKKKEKRGCRAKYGKVLSETQKDRNLIKGINAHSGFLCI